MMVANNATVLFIPHTGLIPVRNVWIDCAAGDASTSESPTYNKYVVSVPEVRQQDSSKLLCGTVENGAEFDPMRCPEDCSTVLV